MYRIKTEAELREDNLWRIITFKNGMPSMAQYFGQAIPVTFNSKCYQKKNIFLWGWIFTKDMYISTADAELRNKKKDYKILDSNEIKM